MRSSVIPRQDLPMYMQCIRASMVHIYGYKAKVLGVL